MCISVDLPEPDGPITVVSWPRDDLERDAAESIDRGIAFAVAAGDVLRPDDALLRSLPSTFPSLGSGDRARP